MSAEFQQWQGKEPKTIIMPDREILLRRLQDVGVLGISDQTNAFYYRLTEYIAGSPIIGPVLNLAWAKAMTDTMSGYPPIVRMALEMNFDQVIETITQDPEVTEEAKEFRKVILEEIKKTVEAAQPNPEDLGHEDSLLDLERYSQARKIADVIFEYVDTDSRKDTRDISMEDRRDQEANPFYNQTHRGFFLEQYYSSPSKLWTPWGEYSFGGSGSGWDNETREKVLQRLGATLYQPVIHAEYGEIGPIYALHKIDDIELPDPVVRPRKAYVPYEEIKNTWGELTKQYFEAQGVKPPLTSAEKFALDDAILEERGKKEPPINDNDIKELWPLSFYVGKVVKYTKDNGKTWHYTKLDTLGAQRFKGGVLGFGANEEVMSHTQVHCFNALTSEAFDRGMVVRPATEEEIRGIKFSYEFNDEKAGDQAIK